MKQKIRKNNALVEIDVHCSHDEMRDIVNIIPNPRNPNKHPDKQVALLAKIIRGNGWRSPIVISKRSGFVVKGHGRLEAAKLLGVQKIPVDLQAYESEAMEWADVIADNRIAELSEIDNEALAALLSDLDNIGLDSELAGFEVLELANTIEAEWPEIKEKKEHQILIKYKAEDEPAILSFINKSTLTPHVIGQQILARIKAIAQA